MKVLARRVISEGGKTYRIGEEIVGWDAEKIAAFAAKRLVTVIEPEEETPEPAARSAPKGKK